MVLCFRSFCVMGFPMLLTTDQGGGGGGGGGEVQEWS